MHILLMGYMKALADPEIGLLVGPPIISKATYLWSLGGILAITLLCFTAQLRSKTAWMAAGIAILALSLYVFGGGRFANTWMFAWMAAANCMSRRWPPDSSNSPSGTPGAAQVDRLLI